MSRRTFWDEPRQSIFRCTECGDKVPNPDDVAFDSRCAKCGAELHSCRNCSFFDSAAEKECRQPVSDRVGGTTKGRLPANTNVDGGGVDPAHV